MMKTKKQINSKAYNIKTGREARRKDRFENPNKYKEMRRKYNLQKYGITAQEFEQLVIDQNDMCAICGDKFDRTPNIDHSHKDGHIRGLLCSRCNTGLGLFKDNIKVLKVAISYLEGDKNGRRVRVM